LFVSQTFIPTTQLAPSSRAAVVPIHEDDIPVGVEKEGTELPPRAVGGLSQSKALLYPDFKVLSLHALFLAM
jgi:hypothetical protein